MDNMDQLSKVQIQENKIVGLFNKIMNLVFDNPSESRENLQLILKEHLNQEELNIINNGPLNAIVGCDGRSLQDILNEEYFNRFYFRTISCRMRWSRT
jgi:uncharacterized protein YpuA (DUF1002 family)